MRFSDFVDLETPIVAFFSKPTRKPLTRAAQSGRTVAAEVSSWLTLHVPEDYGVLF
jgi:hypothetical protein